MLVFVDHGALRRRQNRVVDLGLRGQVLVEVGEIVLHSWHVRWRDLFSNKLFNVQVGEPRMCQNLIDAISTETLGAVLVKQLNNQVLSFWADRDAMAHWVGEAHGTLTNQEIHSVLVTVEEWWDANDHLEDEDTKSPPIDREVMAVSNEHLGGEVLGSSAEGIG